MHRVVVQNGSGNNVSILHIAAERSLFPASGQYHYCFHLQYKQHFFLLFHRHNHPVQQLTMHLPVQPQLHLHYIISRMVEQTFPSGTRCISSSTSLQIEKVISPTLFTAAPSTKRSIFSSVTGWPAFNASNIEGAPSGSKTNDFCFGRICFEIRANTST